MTRSYVHYRLQSLRRPSGRSGTLAMIFGCAMVVAAALAPADAVINPSPSTIFDPSSTTSSTTSTTTTTTIAVPIPVSILNPPTTIVLVDPAAPIAPPVSLIEPVPVVTTVAPTTILGDIPGVIDPLVPTTIVELDGNGVPINRGVSDEDFLEPVPGVDPSLDPALGDASFDDAEPEVVPELKVYVPYGPPIANVSLKAQLAKLSAAQQTIVAEAQARLDISNVKIELAKASLDDLTTQGFASRDQLVRLRSLKTQITGDMRKRAIRQYTGESAVYLRLILDSKDANTLRRRADFVSQAQRRDAAIVESYRQAVSALEGEEVAFDRIRDQRRSEIAVLAEEQKKLEIDLEAVAGVLKAIKSPALNGFVFPVQLPANFIDTYGADRMVGTPFFHPHQGVDIFALNGTPLRAVKRGIVTKIGQARLGGNRLWLIDGDGNYYYYAHLSNFAAGLFNGKVVEAGEIIGFVGTTGNAVGTPAHLHFEIHPGGKGPINPTPILKAVKDANVEDFLLAMQPVFPGGSPTTVPGTPPATLPGGALAPTVPSQSIAPNLDAKGSIVVVPTSAVIRKSTPVSRVAPNVTSPVLPQPSVTAPPDVPTTLPPPVAQAVKKKP